MTEPGSEAFRGMSRQIQAGADTLIGKDSLLGPDLALMSNLDTQLRSFADRLKEHLMQVAPGTEYIFLVHTGIKDASIALNGVVKVIQAEKPSFNTEQKAAIARRSYGVLVRYAIDQSLASTTDGFRQADYDWFIDPQYLEFVDGESPYVRVKNDATDHSLPLPCPAFAGPIGQAPRMPRQLWDGIINIYKDCGILHAQLDVSAAAENTA
jgi:hypothetical protein